MDNFPLDQLIDWNNKPSWKNSARIILKMGYPKSKPLLMDMLQFYQDVNWPVFPEITEALREFDKAYLINGIEKSTELAMQDSDYGWIFGLNILLTDLNIHKDDFNKPALYDYIKANSDKW